MTNEQAVAQILKMLKPPSKRYKMTVKCRYYLNVGVDLRVHPNFFDMLPSINSGQAGQVGPILRDAPMGIRAPQDVGPYINVFF